MHSDTADTLLPAHWCIIIHDLVLCASSKDVLHCSRCGTPYNTGRLGPAGGWLIQFLMLRVWLKNRTFKKRIRKDTNASPCVEC